MKFMALGPISYNGIVTLTECYLNFPSLSDLNLSEKFRVVLIWLLFVEHISESWWSNQCLMFDVWCVKFYIL